MSNFDLAFPIVLRHEGGFVNNAADPGGATKYGVSLRWLKSQGLAGDINHDGDIDIDDIKALTPDLASTFYKTQWWDKYSYGSILAQAVATKVFDTSVNVGPVRAHKFLQEACDVTADGVLGPATLARANAANSVILLADLQNIQAAFYRSLVTSNPDRQQFLAGWLNRAYDRT